MNETINNIIARVTLNDVRDINGDSNLWSDLSIDSLDTVVLASTIDKEFDIDEPFESYLQARKVSDIYEIVAAAIKVKQNADGCV